MVVVDHFFLVTAVALVMWDILEKGKWNMITSEKLKTHLQAKGLEKRRYVLWEASIQLQKYDVRDQD